MRILTTIALTVIELSPGKRRENVKNSLVFVSVFYLYFNIIKHD